MNENWELQAGFSLATTSYMCFMFSVTTPMGIVLGMLLFSITGYDDSSPKALIMEGLLGSFSSGILIYMALVDLIAVDFFHNKMMTSNQRLKKASFIALTLGSASMSVLALWAWLPLIQTEGHADFSKREKKVTLFCCM